MTTVRPAFNTWPLYNSRFRDAVRGMTEEQIAIDNPTLDAPGTPLAARIVDLLAAGFR